MRRMAELEGGLDSLLPIGRFQLSDTVGSSRRALPSVLMGFEIEIRISFMKCEGIQSYVLYCRRR